MSAPRDLAADDRGHIVQYYEAPEFLSARVTEFIALGLEAGEAAVMIATPEHVALVEADLAARGVHVEEARRSGALTVLDARETLALVMRGRHPDRDRFLRVVGGAIAEARPQARYPIVRAFGEMVAVLWTEGMQDAAMELEELWNELLGHHPFSLMCGYPMDAVEREGEGAQQRIAALHTHLMRSEAGSPGD